MINLNQLPLRICLNPLGTVVTAATTSTFHYELIDALAESQDYIILLMKKRYAQPLDKRTLTGGTVEEFKRFLEEKTGKTFRRVK